MISGWGTDLWLIDDGSPHTFLFHQWFYGTDVKVSLANDIPTGLFIGAHQQITTLFMAGNKDPSTVQYYFWNMSMHCFLPML